MLRNELAAVQDTGKMYEIAEKSSYNIKMNTEEREVVELCDAWVKEVGEKGDPNKEIAAFIKRTVNEKVYNAPDELLDRLFDRGSIGEFDDLDITGAPKNNLIAYEAAKGGTVRRSFIDFAELKPFRNNRQVESDLSFVDMRKNGFKSVSTFTTFAVESLNNGLFYDVFSVVDNAIVGGDQVITEGSANPTMTSMDELALYLNDRNQGGGIAVCLNKYAQAIARMSGQVNFMSDAMKKKFNRYGLVADYLGVGIAGISGVKRGADKSLYIPDKKIFGVADKLGLLDMVGEVRVYEDHDNQKEVIHVMIKDFTYNFAITDIDNACKINLA